MPPAHDHAESQVLAHTEVTQFRLKAMEETLKEISAALTTLTRLEHQHIETRSAMERAFKAIDRLGDRLTSVETEMPTLKLTRNWVISGVVGIWGLLAIGLMKLL